MRKAAIILMTMMLSACDLTHDDNRFALDIHHVCQAPCSLRIIVSEDVRQEKAKPTAHPLAFP